MAEDAGIQLETTHGSIVGKLCDTVYGDKYYSFERIPYAKPPLGELRFKAPVPADHWTSSLDCTSKGVKPVQKNTYTNEIEGSEDCLFLNVFTKQLKSDKPLPVLVFFFGGGFEKGDPTSDLHSPDYFMMKDVVVVVISYRVGPFGFLSLADPAAGVPGNAGLKDQVLALSWFKNNSLTFNGDPNNVTVFGESAGAASAHYLMLNPNAKGLFHKAILISGNVLCPWAISPIKDLPARLAKFFDCKDIHDDKAVLKFLQNLPPEDLVRLYILTPGENMNDCFFQFTPVVEPYITKDCAVPKAPIDMMAEAWGNSIPVVMGGTSFEGLLMYGRAKLAPFILETLKDEPQHMLSYDLKQKIGIEKAKKLGRVVQSIHFGDKEIGMQQILNYCDYASYKIIWHPIYRVLNDRLKNATAPTYLYRFDFDSPDFNHQRIKYCGKELRGVAHVDDHSYIWYGSFSWKLATDTEEYKTILRMINLWTSFAANSDPNYENIEQKWIPLNKGDDIGSVQCFNISADAKMMPLPELGKLQKWEQITGEAIKIS